MIRSLSLFLALATLLATPLGVLAQPKKDAANITSATPQEYAALNQYPEITAKLVLADAGVNTVAIRIEYQTWEKNPKYRPPRINTGRTNNRSSQYSMARNMQRMQQLQAQAARSKNPASIQRQIQSLMVQMQRQMMQQQMQQMQQMARAAQSLKSSQNSNNLPFLMKKHHKDFELPISQKIVTRRMTLPQEYDDKGNIRKFTKEEIAKLRGNDPSKPGIAAKFDDLLPGQTVKLYLKAEKVTPQKQQAGGLGGAGGLGLDYSGPRPTVTMIVILQDTADYSLMPGGKN